MYNIRVAASTRVPGTGPFAQIYARTGEAGEAYTNF